MILTFIVIAGPTVLTPCPSNMAYIVIWLVDPPAKETVFFSFTYTSMDPSSRGSPHLISKESCDFVSFYPNTTSAIVPTLAAFGVTLKVASYALLDIYKFRLFLSAVTFGSTCAVLIFRSGTHMPV